MTAQDVDDLLKHIRLLLEGENGELLFAHLCELMGVKAS
jgi:hypothetical protein